MPASYLIIPFAVAVLDWIAVAKDWKRVEYLAKPLVMLFLLVWLWSVGGTHGWLAWFTLGIAFSLIGDVFLMLPAAFFVAGLAAFLVAQLNYVVGFNPTLPPLHLASLILVVPVVLIAGRTERILARSLRASGQKGLLLPVRAYLVVISLMLLSALLTLIRPEWSAPAALLASLGGISFFVSDSLLAWRRFVAPLPIGRVGVMVTYHLAQLCLVWSAAIQYSN
ncbi:MAG: lysoplasmalogenase [Anaerolineales bacterium]|nr:lysoplasmalogenase [Anaerolineales bacterium]